MEEDIIRKKKSLLSKLSLVKFDLQNVNAEDFEEEIGKKVKNIKENVEFLIKKLISSIER